MDIIYKEADSSDANGLIEFLKTVGGETDNLSFSSDSFNISEEQEIRFIEKFKNNKKNIMLVAKLGDQVIANASIERNRIARFSHRAELSIAVLREFWGLGVGTQLMKMLIDFAKSSGAEILYLEVRSDNERAISLYKKFGFENIGTYKRFFKINKKYYDAELMTLEF